MPRELIATAPRATGYREYEEPALEPGQIRICSHFGAFKHGTELIGYRAEDPFRDSTYDPEWQMFVPTDSPRGFPRGLGNQIVGEVVELGPGVERVKLGDRVTIHSTIRETLVTSEKHVDILPEGMSWQAAVCLDPLCFAIPAVRDGHARIGDDVAIFGLGAIGLMAVQCARQQGAQLVVVFDPLEKRRQLALKFGADAALNPLECDAGAEIRNLTNKKGADVCIEVSGNYRAMHHAIRGVAYGGNVVAVAYPKECKGGLDLGREAHFNLPNLIFARGCSDPNRDHPRWSWRRIERAAWRMLCEGRFQTDDLLEPVVPFDQAAAAWQEVDLAPENSIKLGVRF